MVVSVVMVVNSFASPPDRRSSLARHKAKSSYHDVLVVVMVVMWLL